MTADDLVARCRAHGLEAVRGAWAPDAVVLPPGSSLHGLVLPKDAYVVRSVVPARQRQPAGTEWPEMADVGRSGDVRQAMGRA